MNFGKAKSLLTKCRAVVAFLVLVAWPAALIEGVLWLDWRTPALATIVALWGIAVLSAMEQTIKNMEVATINAIAAKRRQEEEIRRGIGQTGGVWKPGEPGHGGAGTLQGPPPGQQVSSSPQGLKAVP